MRRKETVKERRAKEKEKRREEALFYEALFSLFSVSVCAVSLSSLPKMLIESHEICVVFEDLQQTILMQMEEEVHKVKFFERGSRRFRGNLSRQRHIQKI